MIAGSFLVSSQRARAKDTTTTHPPRVQPTSPSLELRGTSHMRMVLVQVVLSVLSRFDTFQSFR